MPLDADLLQQARTAEARVIDAEHDAEVARADFHRAIRRLQLAGASLREIADALGLSHQRVHQIVEAAGGSRKWRRHRSPPAAPPTCCCFCGRAEESENRLVAGPGVYICENCVTAAGVALSSSLDKPRAEVVATGKPAARAAGIRPVGADTATAKCSFCGKRRLDVPGMAVAGNTRICTECLGLCREIFSERLA